MLIGLTGNPGAGKDAAADVLYSADWGRTAFAEALRIEIAAAWRIDVSRLLARATKETPQADLAAGHGMNHDWLRYCAVQGMSLVQPRSPRWLMQQWGSWRRAADPLHWVKHVEAWVRAQRLAGWTDLVVTDVRYANEADALRALGGRIVRVLRPGAPALPADTAEHESELHRCIAAEAAIHNTGTWADLSAEVWRCVNQMPTE